MRVFKNAIDNINRVNLGVMWSAEDEREFDHVEGSEKGPARWGDLKREWRACKTGRTQSPIDILSRRVLVILKTDIIERNYTPGNATIMNRGHDISVAFPESMTFIIIS